MKKLLTTHLMKHSSVVVKRIGNKIVDFSNSMQSVNLLSSSEKKILKRNGIFKNKHVGQRAFVIVNGPSLKTQNIEILKDEITFVVSAFYKHTAIQKWQPTYYSILDKAFFDGGTSSQAFFDELKIQIKDSFFFIPLFRGYEDNRKRNLLPESKAFYVATAGAMTKDIDLTSIVPSFQGVSAFALANAIYMGCSPIYLLGFDHDYLANRGVDQHFYEDATMPGNTRKTVPLADLYAYDDEMLSNYKLWQNYRGLKAIAEKKGIQIINATNGGYLDVFKRVKYEKIFSGE